MTELSSYVFSQLQEGELTLYRGSGDGLDPILLVVSVGDYSGRESLKRLEHEFALRDALDPDWAARPVALVPRDGRMTLVLEDPGGEPLADEEITARLIDRGLQQGRRRRQVLIVDVSGRLRGGGMAMPLEVATGNHVQR